MKLRTTIKKTVKPIKQLFLILFVGFGFYSFSSLSFADTIDNAHLFTTEQIQELNQLANNIEQKSKAKAYVTTINQNDTTTKKYATEFLRDKVGNDNNGVVFLIDMSQRGYQITTSGNMKDFLTDKRIDRIQDTIKPQLSAGQYFEAAKSYLEKTNEFVDKGVPGGHYYIDSATGKITRYKVLTPVEIILSLLVALIISIVVFVSIKSSYQLKRKVIGYPIRDKSSVTLSVQTDTVVRSWVTTRRIPRSDNNDGGGFGDGGSTTYSSGGGTFGGDGGKF